MNRAPFDTTQGESDLLAQLTAASGRLDALMASVQQHTRDAQAALHTAREQEEARFRHAMVALFQEQQQRTQAALVPAIGRAWTWTGALALGALLLLGGYGFLLMLTHQRVQAAQARAEAIELQAYVLAATRQVQITSCGGRPCIKLDADTPRWSSKRGQYVLVDGER
ncbi:MAG: hypothetical protein DI635_08815 [Pseudoxanthomonas suwonensis]|nr:MAG: hypothetical protein DI635_08815 [Pseudoxanthomonas suwonensis]